MKFQKYEKAHYGSVCSLLGPGGIREEEDGDPGVLLQSLSEIEEKEHDLNARSSDGRDVGYFKGNAASEGVGGRCSSLGDDENQEKSDSLWTRQLSLSDGSTWVVKTLSFREISDSWRRRIGFRKPQWTSSGSCFQRECSLTLTL